MTIMRRLLKAALLAAILLVPAMLSHADATSVSTITDTDATDTANAAKAEEEVHHNQDRPQTSEERGKEANIIDGSVGKRSRILHIPEERRLRRAERHERIRNNRDRLKQRYYESTGRELTDDVLQNAIEKARRESPGRFDEGRRRRLTRPVEGFEQYFDAEEHQRKLDHTIATPVNGLIISALSPGFPWNFGRNEFYCASIREIEMDGLPRPKSNLYLSDCYRTREEQIKLEYTEEHELLFDAVDMVFWDWCAETTKVNRGSVRVNRCDITDPKQQWSVVDADDTWRPFTDDFQCVTGSPPEAGVRGGGKLKIKRCTNRGRSRQAQTFLFCEETANCEFVNGFVEPTCVIEDECE